MSVQGQIDDINRRLNDVQAPNDLRSESVNPVGATMVGVDPASNEFVSLPIPTDYYKGVFVDLAAINSALPSPLDGDRADKADGRSWFRAFASSWQEVSTQLPRIRVVGAQTASATLPDAWHLGDVPWTNTTNVVLTLQSDALLMIAGHTSDHFSTGTGTVTIAYNTSLVSVLGHDGVTPLVIETANLENAFVGVTIRYLGVQSGKLIYRVFGNLKTS